MRSHAKVRGNWLAPAVIAAAQGKRREQLKKMNLMILFKQTNMSNNRWIKERHTDIEVGKHVDSHDEVPAASAGTGSCSRQTQ